MGFFRPQAYRRLGSSFLALHIGDAAEECVSNPIAVKTSTQPQLLILFALNYNTLPFSASAFQPWVNYFKVFLVGRS